VSGYAHIRVRRYLHEHGVVREDGRVLAINDRPLRESHRNTIANWYARGERDVPLGRWDEILMGCDVQLWEFEQWEQDTYGNCSFREDVLDSL
jgi:hypothetical protein